MTYVNKIFVVELHKKSHFRTDNESITSMKMSLLQVKKKKKKKLLQNQSTVCYYLSHAENERVVSDSVFKELELQPLRLGSEFVQWHKVGIVAMNTCVADIM